MEDVKTEGVGEGGVTVVALDGDGEADPLRAQTTHRSVPSTGTAPLDFRTDDKAAEVARLEAHGARCADIGQGGQSRVALTDPD